MLSYALGGLDDKFDEPPQRLLYILGLEFFLGLPDIVKFIHEFRRELTQRSKLGGEPLDSLRGMELSEVHFGGQRQRTSNIARVIPTTAFATSFN